MSSEWGPWQMNPGHMPVPGSAIVGVELREKPFGWQPIAETDGDRADCWDWTIDGARGDIIRYRIRRPRALLQLIKMVENLPAPAQPRVDA